MPVARHLVLIKGSEVCYVQWRIERRKGLPLFASVQYVSNPTLLRRAFRSLARHFLLRHRAPFSLVEVRVAGGPIRPLQLLRNHRRRMFKSATLRPDQIDYLYSEITAVPLLADYCQLCPSGGSTRFGGGLAVAVAKRCGRGSAHSWLS